MNVVNRSLLKGFEMLTLLNSQIVDTISAASQLASMDKDDIRRAAEQECSIGSDAAYAYHSGKLSHQLRESMTVLSSCHTEIKRQSDRIEFLEEKMKMVLEMLDTDQLEELDNAL